MERFRALVWGLGIVVLVIVTMAVEGFGQASTPAPQRARRPGTPAPSPPVQQPAVSQPARQPAAPAAGEERELTLEAAITGQPEKPLIQFQRNRPGVKYSEVRIGPTTRPFLIELVTTRTMEISSPDIRAIFPNLFK